jgi:hypothetical protein
MRSSLTCALLIVVLAGPAAAQPIVRDHREPGEAAQWTVDGGAVDSLSFHRLFNTQRRKHLGGSASSQAFEDTRPGMGRVFFENCTRPGEVIFGSDLVAMRFGGDFVAFRNGSPVLQPSGTRSCEFRLIPSGGLGLVPAGSGDGKFAFYSTSGNRYLVFRDSLRWQATSSGQPPGGVAARADFVPVDLFLTSSTINNEVIVTVHLTIQNIGNVASSASQNEMQVRINGQPRTFVITRPIPPGGTQQNPLRFDGPVGHCDQILVELDTNPDLKFQVLQGAFPNDDVFANDRKTMPARFLPASAAPAGPRDIAAACLDGRIAR